VFPFLLGIGEHSIFKAPKATNLSSLPTSFSTQFYFAKGIDVRTDTFDRLKPLLVVLDRRRFLIKIDVEATEHLIFENGSEFFFETPIVLCEILPDATLDFTARFFKEIYHAPYLFANHGLGAADSISQNKILKDWYFDPRESSGHFIDASNSVTRVIN
jgi:hypothetical protein